MKADSPDSYNEKPPTYVAMYLFTPHLLYCCKVNDYTTDCAIYQNVRIDLNHTFPSLPPSLPLYFSPCRVKGC